MEELAVNPSERFEAASEQVASANIGGSAAISDMLFVPLRLRAARAGAARKTAAPDKCSCASANREGAPLEHALDAAAAVEMLHNYSLVHDDIEDRDEFRHGRRTLWSAYGIAASDQRRRCDVCAEFSHALDAREGAARPARALDDDRAFAPRAPHDVRRPIARSAVRERGPRRACRLRAYDRVQDRRALRSGLPLGRAAPASTEARVAAVCRGRASLRYGLPDSRRCCWAFGRARIDRKDLVAGDLARRKWTFRWFGPSPGRRRRRASRCRGLRRGDRSTSRGRQAVVEALEELGAREAATRAVAEPMAVVERRPNRALRDYLLETLADTRRLTGGKPLP